ncbi:tRNA (adenosine(37)-N6)-threonylcarbamoyltransferase complex ATPase subunit type 1 TsaE [Candidatus Peregrinibacteria bacterium]|nr:tRNA (adenosine(37)-N6)-threonylcarbamoyltransferase complex ATPase subunit type 1 TsaE [Candidatus Peregrinibacteria bacterium]
MQKYKSNSPEQTKKIAEDLVKSGKFSRFWCLEGTLGGGKTVFSKGLARALGIPEKEIKSPTYTFVREYKKEKIRFLHFDFYRIESVDDLMAHDVQEMFSDPNTWIVVEWPDRVKHLLPKKRWEIQFEHLNEKERLITVSKQG